VIDYDAVAAAVARINGFAQEIIAKMGDEFCHLAGCGEGADFACEYMYRKYSTREEACDAIENGTIETVGINDLLDEQHRYSSERVAALTDDITFSEDQYSISSEEIRVDRHGAAQLCIYLKHDSTLYTSHWIKWEVA
jgi:hypothetical protein